jgi:hypothetical protein
VDTYNTLWNRLLNRCPAAGAALAQQFVGDAWSTLQSKREWSFRRRSGCFAPPTIYQTGTASTNVSSGQPTLITGVGTAWTPQMIGSQIRLGGLLYPYYDIVGYLSPTELLIGQPWAGPDVTAVPYWILQIYYPVPADFNYFYVIVSPKDGYRLWTNITEADLALLDPQRTNSGQTYAAVFRDYAPQFGGTIGPVIPVAATGATPISTTSTGFSYVANASYIVQVVTGGATGTATFQWMRAGQTSFSPPSPVTTAPYAQTLMDGVQVYWPLAQTYNSGDLFVINCISIISTTGPRYELWPSPSYSGYLYPYIYIAREYALTVQEPQLPPFIANRGEVLLEMALQKCAEFPGADPEHPNVYFNLNLAKMHMAKAEQMIWDLERNDEEIGVTNVEYQQYPFYPAPWMDGHWMATHAPFL